MIRLFEGADPSTFMHEMSHHYLTELAKLAKMFPESKAARDYETIMQWASWEKGQVKAYAGTASAKEFQVRDEAIRKAEKKGDALEVNPNAAAQYLPLVGGAISGAIIVGACPGMRKSGKSAELYFYGGTTKQDGAALGLRAVDFTGYGKALRGSFGLCAVTKYGAVTIYQGWGWAAPLGQYDHRSQWHCRSSHWGVRLYQICKRVDHAMGHVGRGLPTTLTAFSSRLRSQIQMMLF